MRGFAALTSELPCDPNGFLVTLTKFIKKVTIFAYQICFVESIIIKYTFMCCSISLCYHRVPLAIHDGNNNAWYIRKFGQITLNYMFTEHCILLSLSPKKNNIYHFTVLTGSHTLRGNSILYQYS